MPDDIELGSGLPPDWQPEVESGKPPGGSKHVRRRRDRGHEESSVSQSESQSEEVEFTTSSSPHLRQPNFTPEQLARFLYRGEDDFIPSMRINIDLMMTHAMQQSARDMLDRWCEAVKQEGEERLEDDQREHQLKLDKFLQDVRNRIKKDEAEAATEASLAVIGLSSAIASGDLSAVNASAMADYAIVLQAMHALDTQTDQVVSPEQLALLGAFWVSSATYQAALLSPTLMRVIDTPSQTVDQATARAYAEIVVRSVEDPDFGERITSQLDVELSPEQTENTVSRLKMSLLMTALAALANTESQNNRIEPEKIRVLLVENSSIDELDPKQPVLAAVRQLLTSLTEEQRVERVDSIVEYLASNPDTKALLEPAQVFHQIFDTDTDLDTYSHRSI